MRSCAFEVVADGPLGNSAPELVHVDVAAQPGSLLHVQGRLEVGLLAERQHADEQVDLRDLASRGVDQPLADGRSRPVDLAGLPGLALDSLGEVAGCRPVAVLAAELGVAHGDRALATAAFLVLVVEQSKVDPDLRHLLVNVPPVGLLEHALAHVPVGIEEPIDVVVWKFPDVSPRDATLRRDVKYFADGLH
jgi:hypothetical protein